MFTGTMGSRLSATFGILSEMPRPKGSLGAPMRAVVDWAKTQEDFTYREAFAIWVQNGGNPNAEGQFRPQFRRLLAQGRPDEFHPIVVTNPDATGNIPKIFKHRDSKGGGGFAKPLGKRQADAASALGRGNGTGRSGAAGYVQKRPAPSALKGATAPNAFSDEEPTNPDIYSTGEIPHPSSIEHGVHDEPAPDDDDDEGGLGPDAATFDADEHGNPIAAKQVPEPDEEPEQDDDYDEDESDEGDDYMPSPDDAEFEDLEMLEQFGVTPTDEVWDEIAGSDSWDDALAALDSHPRLSQLFKSGRKAVRSAAVSVARFIMRKRAKID